MRGPDLDQAGAIARLVRKAEAGFRAELGDDTCDRLAAAMPKADAA